MSDCNPSERFLPVPGFPGYRVSDFGRVQSCRSNNPRVLRDRWRDMKHYRCKTGHLSVQLKDELRRGRVIFVHRLVLMAFIGPCPPGMEGCHDDGDPSNNYLGNLRWDTHINNLKDRDRHGRTARGERNGGGRKLTEAKVAIIKALLAAGWGCARIAPIYNIAPGMVYHIRNGASWRHVSPYEIG